MDKGAKASWMKSRVVLVEVLAWLGLFSRLGHCEMKLEQAAFMRTVDTTHFQVVEASNLLECANACEDAVACQSVNFEKAKKKCYFLNTTRYYTPTNTLLISDPKSVFVHDITSPCVWKRPVCHNVFGRCIPKDKNHFECQCATGSGGDLCTQGKISLCFLGYLSSKIPCT